MRVLLIDDSPFVRKAYQANLRRHGFDVDLAAHGREGLNLIRRSSYDVVVSDLNMPEMSGMEFLKALRELDPELPVVLLTDNPSVDSAMEAVELRAYRYLPKSSSGFDTLIETLTKAGQHHSLARLKREMLGAADNEDGAVTDRVTLERRFASALGHLWIAFQPIVAWPARRVHGYEVLMRSHEGSLRRPSDILAAAERLGRLIDLGRQLRQQTAAAVPLLPFEASVFVNLHPVELNDPLLYREEALGAVASRVVLEITERASLENVPDLPRKLNDLRALGFRLAVDDLGAGYSGLTSMVHIEPEYVKLDMSLVRGIDGLPTKQKLVSSMALLCDDLGMRVIAEGIETEAERDILGGTGCGLQQGYFFARPHSHPPAIHWG